MKSADLSYAFGLPPEKAVDYFKSKGYIFSWNWQDTWQESHAKAFTVAKAMRLDVLQDIREEVQKALDEGITFQQFKKELIPKLQTKGWWGKKLIGDEKGAQEVQLGSPRRLQTIYQTNLQTAYMTGRFKEMLDNVEDRPYWQYVAVMDSKTRPGHRRLNGKVFRYDDPFWKTFYPPNGWNCRCRVRALSTQDIKNRGLEISSGGDYLREEEVTINRAGDKAKVAVYTDPKTGLDIHPDAGWSYNPGEAFWQPDWSKYPKEMKGLVDEVKASVEDVLTKTIVPKPVFNAITHRKLRKYADNSFDEAPDEINALVNKVKDDPQYETSRGWRSFYRPGFSDTVHIGSDHIRDNRYDTMLHEIGHLVDFRVQKIDPTYQGSIRKDIRFINAVQSDGDSLKADSYRQTMIKGAISNTTGASFQNDLFLRDIFGSLTWDWSRVIGGGHTPNYYRRNPSHREGEIFGNLFAIYSRSDKTAWNYLERELPKITGAFKEIIMDLREKI